MMRRFVLLCICLAALAVGCVRQQDSQSNPAAFDVVITAVGQSKILAIKGVREVTGLGLKDAKDLVESAPVAVRKDLPKAEAEGIAQKLRESGMTVEIRPH
jgi:large subunit ribosomal protein L7/L12